MINAETTYYFSLDSMFRQGPGLNRDLGSDSLAYGVEDSFTDESFTDNSFIDDIFIPVKSRPIIGILTCLFLLVQFFIFSGCGVKTHPYPEMVTLPGPVKSLTQELDQNGHLWLTWDIPEYNMADRPLKALDHFEVWAADYDLKTYCDTCPVNFSKLDEVYLKAPAPGQNYYPGPYIWQIDLSQGRVYIFRVAGFSSRGGVHPLAWQQETVWMVEPPGALKGFSAQADDLSVRLSWPEPPLGQKVQVQRRMVGGKDFVTLDPERDGKLDLNVAYENEYVYRARLINPQGESLIPGPWTGEVVVKIEDSLPPPPPAFLECCHHT
jgi:hypothetical protein